MRREKIEAVGCFGNLEQKFSRVSMWIREKGSLRLLF